MSKPRMSLPAAHHETAATTLERLSVDPASGLSRREAEARLADSGPNQLKMRARTPAWRLLLRQLANLMVLLLAIAAVLSFVMVDWVEGVAILVVIVINVAIGFAMEYQATRSMEALQVLARVNARVRREGEVLEIRAVQLVPGDVVLLEGGDVVSADIRLIEASNLQADESALTGESVPVAKSAAAVPEAAPLAERSSMVYKGTAITRGAGEGVVVATGLATELGRISSLVEATEDERTPLEQRLERLGRRLIWLTLALAGLLVLAGIAVGRDLELMLRTAVALAVATVPEGLPVVATIALARGMWRMAERNVLINRLSAVETLGATGVICTDKTGTLTENRMTVTRLALPGGDVEVEGERFLCDGQPPAGDREVELRRALEIGAMCNNASLQGERWSGDPLEVALLAAARAADLTRAALEQRRPRIRVEAFDTSTRMMATLHEDGTRFLVAVKGAPEAVIGACSSLISARGQVELSDAQREAWLQRNAALAADGLRVIALASNTGPDAPDDLYARLALVGLVGLLDPPRGDVRGSIAACREAGIRVVMVTGDQPATARAVATAVGLVEPEDAQVVHGAELGPVEDLDEPELERLRGISIFARVDPEQKLDIIDLHQSANEVVAMTGDGVNDAPALKKADIGVAMGRRGTQVAREAADMVLKDDAFASIVEAVRQGRVIFGNIRKFALYLLSCNTSEVLVVGLATAASAPLPLLPLQILFLNLVTDVFPALALGVGPGDPSVMRARPRPADEPILTRRHWFEIAGFGIVITVAVLGAFALAFVWLGLDQRRAVTVSFLSLAFAQLWHVFNMRSPGSRLGRDDVTRNPFIWGALLFCSALLLAAVGVPALNVALDLENPGARGWALALGASLLPLLVGQAARLWRRGGPHGPARRSV
jgi:Ca2+-transporting ATPase